MFWGCGDGGQNVLREWAFSRKRTSGGQSLDHLLQMLLSPGDFPSRPKS